MPSALADALFERLIDAFPPHHAYPATAFEREPMPAPVAHFLSRLLERRLQHEASSLGDLPRSPWFDAGHAAVQQARQALTEALVTHGQFPPEEWEQALRQATEQTTAYLVQPTTTLVAFVFQEGHQATSAETIDRRLGYFAGYRYLSDTVRLYMEQKGVPELTRARFADLLRQIDRQMTSDFDADDWLKMMKPLFVLARHAYPEASGVSVELLQAFFEDKDAEVYVQRLQTAREHGTTALDKDGVRGLLKGPVAPPPQPEPERPPEPSPPSIQPEPANGPVPLWKQFRQQETQPPLAEQVATEVRRETVPRRPPPAKEAEPRWKQFRNESSPPASAAPAPPRPHPTATTSVPSSDLATMEHAVLGTTGAHNRDLFIRHLFNGDHTDYKQVLSRLDAASSWTDASKIIASEVFRKNQVNIYSDPAVLFTDAVEARYRA